MNLVANEPKKTAKKKVGQTAKNKKSGTVGKKKTGAQANRSKAKRPTTRRIAESSEVQIRRDSKNKVIQMLKDMEIPSANVRNRRMKVFQQCLLGIVDSMEKRIQNKTNLHDLFYANPGSFAQMSSTYSIYGEKGEEFTKRYVIEPLLKALGYDDIAYETKLGTNHIAADYALILDRTGTKGRGRGAVVVEAKSMYKTDGKKRGKVQLDKYLVEFNGKSVHRPYIGILTDGQDWMMRVLNSNGTIKSWSLNIQQLLRWAYHESIGESRPFPRSTYRKFMNVFGNGNIQNYGNCLYYGIAFRIPDEKGNIVGIDDLPKDKVVGNDDEMDVVYFKPVANANVVFKG